MKQNIKHICKNIIAKLKNIKKMSQKYNGNVNKTRWSEKQKRFSLKNRKNR